MLSIRTTHRALQPWSCVARWLGETLGEGLERSLPSLVCSNVQDQACQEIGAHPFCTRAWTRFRFSLLAFPLWFQNRIFCAICGGLPNPPSHSSSWHFTVSLKFNREFPGGLVVRILGFQCCGLGSILGQRTEIPQATQPKKKRKGKVW